MVMFFNSFHLAGLPPPQEAGGGIGGGLVLALAAKHKGYEVKVFEKDVSTFRGEGRHRGPIQPLSGALAVLEAIDQSVARQIMEDGSVTANRTNGLANGVSGDRQEAKYSGYTCYSGITNYVLPYIDAIGYKVFLGLNQYFVASDVSQGKKRLLDLSLVQLQGSIRYRYDYGYPHHHDKISKQKYYSVRVVESGNEVVLPNLEEEKKKKLRVLVDGGGIGGLVLALAAKHRGYEVKVFEKDLSAVRGEGRHRGPIQLLSIALAVLEAIDQRVARQIMEAGRVTGNRTNGLADEHETSKRKKKWFSVFDLFTPASRKRLPLTLVICRMALQDILVNAVGSNILRNKSKVVDFIQEPSKIRVILENGEHHDGDILIGADGIWSEVRSKLFGRQEANYSGLTCYRWWELE
ncbi:Zeaxanthin epoxidase, chloroplastic [Glycine max]|nr:Zeaxanthin epoxidase, chloroplastic [Glycine max]